MTTSTSSSSAQLERVPAALGKKKPAEDARTVSVGTVTKIKKDKKPGKSKREHYKPSDEVLKKPENADAIALLDGLVDGGFPPS